MLSSRGSSRPRDQTHISCIGGAEGGGGVVLLPLVPPEKLTGHQVRNQEHITACEPKDQTYISCVSCIANRFFTTELSGKPKHNLNL